MAIKLNGSTSGSVALDAPADTSPSGTDVTLTLPTSAGSSGQYLQTNGSGTLSWQTVSTSNLTWTSTQSNTGTEITFSSIPAAARRITIVFSEMGHNSSSGVLIRLGHSSGTYITSGYNSDFHWYNSGDGMNGISTAFSFASFGSAAWIWNGTMYLHRVVDNTWIFTSSAHYNAADGASVFGNGRLVMGSNVLDAIQITVSGGGTFDDGYIGFGYEV